MRKQYYFKQSKRGLLAWDVDRLVELSTDFPRKYIALKDVRELDENVFGEGENGTWRSLIDHLRLIHEADLSYPIILSASGAVMDGRHRVAKAVFEGHSEIVAVQFAEDPPPDYVGVAPDDLPY